jgi:hypothetical protein
MCSSSMNFNPTYANCQKDIPAPFDNYCQCGEITCGSFINLGLGRGYEEFCEDKECKKTYFDKRLDMKTRGELGNMQTTDSNLDKNTFLINSESNKYQSKWAYSCSLKEYNNKKMVSMCDRDNFASPHRCHSITEIHNVLDSERKWNIQKIGTISTLVQFPPKQCTAEKSFFVDIEVKGDFLGVHHFISYEIFIVGKKVHVVQLEQYVAGYSLNSWMSEKLEFCPDRTDTLREHDHGFYEKWHKKFGHGKIYVYETFEDFKEKRLNKNMYHDYFMIEEIEVQKFIVTIKC